MRALPIFCIFITGLASSGCGCLPPFRTEAIANLFVRTPISAKVDASLNMTPDLGQVQEVAVLPGAGPGGKVAVIDVDGLLVNTNIVGPYSQGDNPVAVFQEKLMAAASDPAVKAVVVRINTPGGGVGASELMGRSLLDFRQHTGKPVVACLQDMGAGGGYYLACCCDEVFAIPSSVVGGIGVALNLYYMELAMEHWNVFENSVKAGERIDMGTPVRKMTADEKKMLTEMAKDYHANFRRVVLEGRKKVPADSKVFDGRVMSAAAAKHEGLIDCLGFLPDAIERAKEMSGAPCPAVVMYRRQGSPARSLYETVPNTPVQSSSMANIPGLDRSRLPLFLYMWDVEPTVLRMTGN